MTSPATPQLVILADPNALADHVATWLLTLAKAKQGPFSLCLSGGSTPKRLYQRMANAPYRDAFPWDRTHLFWGDERFVAPDDPLSNYRMVKEALLSQIPIADDHVHPMPTEGVSPETAAKAYQKELQTYYGATALHPEALVFDVTLLGLGPDGHTASLFPGTKVLDERDLWVAAVIGAKSEARLTLTYPALESSRNIAFLVAGEDKRDILAAYRRGDDLPSTRLRPQGELWIFSDVAAQPQDL